MDLFSSISLRHIVFKNRAVMAPIVINSANADGSVTRAYRDFFLARARGGVGYIVLGGVFVHPDGRGFHRQLGLDRDEIIGDLAEMVASIREHARLGVQLSFKGAGRLPESYTREEIRSYRHAFVEAALRARQCGFDAIELHGCHEYWVNYFLSPYFNHRTDEYGGSLENRFRLLRETVEELRSTGATDLLLGVRLSVEDFIGSGLRLDESIEIGQRLEALGVDYLSASVGIGATQYRTTPPMEVPRSTELTLSRALQHSVGIPVIGVGRLDRPKAFREAVENGYVSMAAAARALIADPEFVVKMQEGREEEIRPCIACNHCLTCIQRNEEVRCVVNPYVGRDLMPLVPLSRPMRVTVVGGGCAGLTAATIAASRGATVTLREEKPQLGGILHIGKRPPFKGVIDDFIQHLAHEAVRAGVCVQLGHRVTAAELLEEESDEVILGTGARPLIPAIPGMDQPRVVLAEDLLQRDAVPGGDYLVVGGGLVGLETAEYICKSGNCVTVAEMLGEVGGGLGPMRLKLILDRLIKSGVNILTRAKILSVQDRMVDIQMRTGVVTLGPFDWVVLATGYQSDRTLWTALDGKRTVRLIGDVLQPRTILESVTDGFECALDLKA